MKSLSLANRELSSVSCAVSSRLAIYIITLVDVFLFFFFSSRRRHTRLQGDWSSDVCSSDLTALDERAIDQRLALVPSALIQLAAEQAEQCRIHRGRRLRRSRRSGGDPFRSEERRVGKEGRSRWSPYH